MFFPSLGGSLSAIAASLVLLLAAGRWLHRTASGREPNSTDNIIFLNLMLADLIQAIGVLPMIWWMADGVITEGRLCTAQAVIKQVGANGVALSSLAIAVHTFCVLVLRWTAPKFFSKLVVLMIWIFIALVIAIPYSNNKLLYGDAGYWCWVQPAFLKERLVTQYLWLWVSLALVIILYAIMFAVMRGLIIVENGVWYWYRNYTPRFGTGQPAKETQEERDSNLAMANLLLLYPVVNFVCITPNSFSRWFFYSGTRVSHQVTLITATLFSLSGTFNALLFFFTRPHLVVGSVDSPPPAPAVDIETQAFNDGEPTSPSSRKFGSLPSRTPTASDNVPPDLGGQFDPYNSIPLAEGTDSSIRTSPRQTELDSSSHATYLSGKRSHGDFRSKPASPALVEEESYGYLPR